MPRTKTTILGTDRLGEERAVKTTEDAEQDGEDEGLSCIDLTRRTAPPMAVEGAKQRAAERAAARAAARAVARQLGGGEDGRRGAKQPSQEQGSCGAPGCKYADFHLGPCSNLGADNGGERKRRRSSSGRGMAAKAAKAAKVKEVKAAKAATKATVKLLQEQEEAKAAALVRGLYWYGVYEVERLVNVRSRKKRTEYLVRWVGWAPEHDSWEDESSIHTAELIVRFNRERKLSHRKRETNAVEVEVVEVLPDDDSGTLTVDAVVVNAAVDAEEHASAAVPTEVSSSLQASSNCPLVCPVSLEHMQDPVALPCGHAFERSAIESHLTTSKDCPVCRRRVPRGEITFGTTTMIRDLTRAIEADPAFAKTLGCRCCNSE